MAQQESTWKILLRGISPIMFDRYAGDNNTELTPWQKVYTGENGDLVIPALNLMSFLSAQNTPSAPKRFVPIKEYKRVCQAMQSYVSIQPWEIPLTRDGKPIRLSVSPTHPGETDEVAGAYIHKCVARVKGGIPNPKARPVIKLPWELSFDLSLYPNEEINENMVRSMFEKGGVAIGLGTYRGVFGKFQVAEWK